MSTEKQRDLNIQAEVRSIVHDRTGIDILKSPLLNDDVLVVSSNNNIELITMSACYDDTSVIDELGGEAHFRFRYKGQLYYIYTSFNQGDNKEYQDVFLVDEKLNNIQVNDPDLRTLLQLQYIKELAKGGGIDDLSEENRKRLIHKLLDFVEPIESIEREKDVLQILEFISNMYGEDFKSIAWINNKFQAAFSLEPRFQNNKYHRFYYDISDGCVSFILIYDLDINNYKNSGKPEISDDYSTSEISTYDKYLLAFRNSIHTMLNNGFTISQIVDIFEVMVYRYRNE